MSKHHSVSQGIAGVAALLLTTAMASTAHAAYYYVYTSPNPASPANIGDGYCNLAEAVKSVNEGVSVSDCPDQDPSNPGMITLIEAPGMPYSSYHYVIDSLTLSQSVRFQPSEEGLTAYIDGTGTQAFKINSGVDVNFYGIDISHVGSGSGRLIYNSGNLYMSNGTISNGNVTTEPNGYGGGIYNEGWLSLSSYSIVTNSAKRGGGIYNKGGTGSITLYGVTIWGNLATMAGGGIYNVNALGGSPPPDDISAFSSSISQNSARAGGGIFNKGQIELHDSSLVGNNTTSSGSSGETCGDGISCDGFGGGACSVAASSGTYSRIGADGASITDNSAVGRGGGFYSAGQLNLLTVTIARNSADRGGAIFASHSGNNHYCSVSSPADFTFSYIYDNTASSGQYSILDWDTSTATCVMAENRVQAFGNSYPTCAPDSANPACPQ